MVLTQRGRGAAVLLDLVSYRELLDKIELLESMQRGLSDVAAGRVLPHDEVKARLTERYSRPE